MCTFLERVRIERLDIRGDYGFRLGYGGKGSPEQFWEDQVNLCGLKITR